MAVQNGDKILVNKGGTIINATVSSDLSVTWDMIDITTKDSNQSKEYLSGEDDATVSIEGNYDDVATEGFAEMFTLGTGRTAVTIIFGLQDTGKAAYQFQALLSDLSLNGPKNDASTWSATIQKTGPVTAVTIS